MRPKPAMMIVLGLATVLALSAVPASAKKIGNPGTIKVHDEEVVDPPKQNDPHVSCNFWIEGFKMADDSGHLTFERIPPTANPPEDAGSHDWTADGPDHPKGFHFLAGPFSLSPGHYRVEAFLDIPHPGSEDHFTKAKVFWVEECGGNCPPGTVPVDGRCCPEVQVAQDGIEECVLIPFFPSQLALGVAGIGSVAGFALLRRRS